MRKRLVATNGVRGLCLVKTLTRMARDARYTSFCRALRAVGQTGVERIRLTSSNPKDLADEIYCSYERNSSCHASPSSCGSKADPHAFSKKMNRSYTEEYLDVVSRLSCSYSRSGAFN